MYKPNRHKNIMLKMLNNSLVDLPTPSNISLWWNFGSLLGACLMMQMITGIIISMHYCSDPQLTFISMMNMLSNVNMGTLFRYMHANGASLLFICLYIHTGRGLYYMSYKMTKTWIMGTMILMGMMATAFLGYVLPWGQMSFWGATVITNLLSTIPYVGNQLVNWLWGGFAISKPTLMRFFTLHFALPFLMSMMVMMHLLLLHTTGSSNPLGLNSNSDKIPFHPFFSSSDSMGLMIMLSTLIMFNLLFPLTLFDPDNFTPANPLSTPVHIQPEWYFLFAYAILRSIPNKLGGVIALISAIMILMVLPVTNKSKFKMKSFYPVNKMMYWLFSTNLILLTWIGANPVEDPFVQMGQLMTYIYFSYFIINPIIMWWWDNMTK
uniref:Cytochrome b n=1 Tax=Hackeriella veitchi TaxID=60873 RepID=L7N6J1_9HEMI|nr:cytochrome b [Hackeriella veitchi]ACV96711.1 cytochrome b [Hackeriella veitchi]